MLWQFLYWDSIHWFILLIVLLNWKLYEESVKKVNFENWKLGNTGKEIDRSTFVPHAKWDKPAQIGKYFFYGDLKSFYVVEDKCDIFIFYNVFGTVFCGRYFFQPCCMACYNFCKLVKTKGGFGNFAISTMGLFVTMV